jgi:hypothetical protein
MHGIDGLLNGMPAVSLDLRGHRSAHPAGVTVATRHPRMRELRFTLHRIFTNPTAILGSVYRMPHKGFFVVGIAASGTPSPSPAAASSSSYWPGTSSAMRCGMCSIRGNGEDESSDSFRFEYF